MEETIVKSAKIVTEKGTYTAVLISYNSCVQKGTYTLNTKRYLPIPIHQKVPIELLEKVPIELL